MYRSLYLLCTLALPVLGGCPRNNPLNLLAYSCRTGNYQAIIASPAYDAPITPVLGERS